MDWLTIGIIVSVSWVALMVIVVAICKAAAQGDAAARRDAAMPQRVMSYAPEGTRPFERPALG
jgi:hypothetical protein